MVINLKPSLYYNMLGLIQQDKRIEAMRLLRRATSSGPVSFPLSTAWRIIQLMQTSNRTPDRAGPSTVADCIQDINLDQDIALEL